MSIKINIEELSWEIRQKLSKELEIKLVTKFNTKHIYPFAIENDDIILPFAYATRGLHLKRPIRDMYPSSSVEFLGIPREEQKEVINEALGFLNKTGSVMISGYPGFGKCLKYNTLVMTYDGNTKYVQDIKVGDLLMGDDSTSRKVLSTCRGNEKMYNIISEEGDVFGCNESHILSLKFINNYSKWDNRCKKYWVRYIDVGSGEISKIYFDNEEEVNNICDIVDIELKKYLELSDEIKKNLKLYRVPVLFEEKELDMDPYEMGKLIGNNFYDDSEIFEKYIKNSGDNQLKLLAGLIDSIGNYEEESYILCTQDKILSKDIIFLCRSLGFRCKLRYEDKYIINISGNIGLIPVKTYKILINKNIDLLINFDVFPIEDTNYYGFVIDGNHRFLLGDFIVTHNTMSAIKMSTMLKFKVCIIVNKIILMKQWEESIFKFCPTATVQKVTSSSEKKDCDFYIINAQNTEKMGRYYFSHIGCLIVDEAHLIMAETLSRAMQYIYPRYLIGLTATPYRPDGLDILLTLYFGVNKIVRKLSREHVVYKVETGFKPTIEKTADGRINWGVILDSQANDVDRNEIIVKIIKKFDTRNFLVLVKRITQGEYIKSRLEEEGENVTSLLGTVQEYDIDSRILIGTSGKIGVGFDHVKLDALLLGADIEEYFIQYLGRVFRTKEVQPVVFDLVDNYSILTKHFSTRQKVYQEHGGIVKKLDIKSLK